MSQSQPRLSVCVAATPSAADLGRCLQSLAPIDGEILVGGEAADLADIASQFGARYVPVPPGQAPETQRRLLLAQATGRWVLLLRADEAVIAGHQSLERVVAVEPQGRDVCLVEIIGEGGSGLAARLHPRHPDLIWPGETDNAFDRRLGETRTGAAYVTGLRLHRQAAVATTPGQDLLRQGLRQHPRDPHLHFHLGLALARGGDPRGGVRHFRHALGILAELKLNADYAPAATALAMGLELQLGHIAQAHRLAIDGETIAEASISYWLNRGSIMAALGELEAARTAWLTGWQRADETNAPEAPQLALLLAATYPSDSEQARAWLSRTSAAIYPRLSPAQRVDRLGVVILATGSERLESSLESVQRIADELVIMPTRAAADVTTQAASFAATIRSGTEDAVPPLGVDTPQAINRALAAVETDWLLILQAGETLDRGTIPVLHQLLLAAPHSASVFALARMSRTVGEPPGEACRLFRRLPGLHLGPGGFAANREGQPFEVNRLVGGILWTAGR